MEKVKKPFYKKWWVWTIVVIIVISVAANQGDDTTLATSAAPSTNSAATSSVEAATSTATAAKVSEVSEKKAEPVVEKAIVVSAEVLAKAFDENEIKGNQLYKDKMVEVKGKINDIGEVLGSTYIVLSDGQEFSIMGVQCSFSDKSEISKIADLKKGDIVTVIGKVDGLSLNVSVDDCKFK